MNPHFPNSTFIGSWRKMEHYFLLTSKEFLIGTHFLLVHKIWLQTHSGLRGWLLHICPQSWGKKVISRQKKVANIRIQVTRSECEKKYCRKLKNKSITVWWHQCPSDVYQHWARTFFNREKNPRRQNWMSTSHTHTMADFGRAGRKYRAYSLYDVTDGITFGWFLAFKMKFWCNTTHAKNFLFKWRQLFKIW